MRNSVAQDGESLIGSMPPKQALWMGLVMALVLGPLFVEQVREMFDRDHQCHRFLCSSEDTSIKTTRTKRGGLQIDYWYCDAHEPKAGLFWGIVNTAGGVSWILFPSSVFMLFAGAWALRKQRKTGGLAESRSWAEPRKPRAPDSNLKAELDDRLS